MVTLGKMVLYATLSIYCRMHSIECCYTERHYAEYRTFNVILSAIMCDVIMLSVIMLSIVMLSTVTPSVTMLSVVRLSVIMLSDITL
jgi:hypothetical protein